MGKFAEQQKMKDEARDRERLSRETLGKFFYDAGVHGDGARWVSGVDFRRQ